DAATLAAVRADPEVRDATTRTSLLARVKVGDRPWRVLMLFASDPGDPQRIATVSVARGSWPPPPGALMLERTALPFLGVGTGDRVLVQTPGAPAVAMTVSGAVHDGGVAPAAQEQTAYGYLTTPALARLGAPTTLDQLKIVTADPGDVAAIDRVAQRTVATLARYGHPVDHI